MLKWLRRFKEPSTYAGLACLGTLFGVKELAMFAVPEVGIMIASLAAIFLPEGKLVGDPLVK